MRNRLIRDLLGASALSTTLLCGWTAMAGDISGVVTDPATKKPLASATVSIPASEHSAQTDASGKYVLKDIAEGQYTVEVSLTGYHSSSVNVSVPKDGVVTANFGPYKSNDGEVVVVANRFRAKNVQMASSNTIAVISATELEHTAVHNAAEILGLLPSVNVMNTGNSFMGGIDGASRGEGQYISIRNMNGEYDVNLVNGMEVPTGQPYSRSVQLNLIPPSGLNTIVLAYGTMANMDGDAIGGTVDFRTPTAYDFNSDRSGSLAVSGNYESQAAEIGANHTGFGVNGDFQQKFLDGALGVYVSAYYQIRHYANQEYNAEQEAHGGDQAWQLNTFALDASGNEIVPKGVSAENDLTAAGFNLGVSSGNTEMFGGTTSIDWHPTVDTTIFTRATYAHYTAVQNNSLNQVVGEDVRDPNHAISIGGGLYQNTIPVISDRLWYETNPEHADLITWQTGLTKDFDHWHFAPSLFAGYGKNDEPNHVELWTNAQATVGGGVTGGNIAYGATNLVSYGSDNFPQYNPPASTLYPTQNPGSQTPPEGYELTQRLSYQDKYGVRGDGSYSFDDGLLKKIDFGFKYQSSHREVNYRDYSYNSQIGNATTIGTDSNVFLGYYPSLFGGIPVPNINHQLLVQRLNSVTNTPVSLAEASDVCAGNSAPTDANGNALPVSQWTTAEATQFWNKNANNFNCNTLIGSEDVTAAYVMGTFKYDKFELITGLRDEMTITHNRWWEEPGDSTQLGYWASNRSYENVILPSAFLTYRPDALTVYKADIYEAYTRPPMFQLGGSSTRTVDQQTGLITITEGNPNLKPIQALNADLSGAWRNHSGGFLSMGIFYKLLRDYEYDSGSGYIAPATSTTGLTQTIKPTNGGNGSAEGFELQFQQKLLGLAEPLDGFAIQGNLTKMASRVKITPDSASVPTQGAPDFTFNGSINYAKNNFSADLSYTYRSEFLENYSWLPNAPANATGLDEWQRPTQRLDLHLGYKLGNAHIDFSVANLLKDYSYWSHIGKDSLTISDILESGRQAVLTVKYVY